MHHLLRSGRVPATYLFAQLQNELLFTCFGLNRISLNFKCLFAYLFFLALLCDCTLIIKFLLYKNQFYYPASFEAIFYKLASLFIFEMFALLTLINPDPKS